MWIYNEEDREEDTSEMKIKIKISYLYILLCTVLLTAACSSKKEAELEKPMEASLSLCLPAGDFLSVNKDVVWPLYCKPSAQGRADRGVAFCAQAREALGDCQPRDERQSGHRLWRLPFD